MSQMTSQDRTIIHQVRAGRHQLYVREVGNPDGFPVVILHGGPGSGSDPAKAGIFDLARCRVFLPDQRGAGKSQPSAAEENSLEDLVDNTLPQLIDDLDLLKRELQIDRPWIVAGGSFGSSLAISYALKHPTDAAGMLLWSVFLCRERDFGYMWAPTGYPATQRKAAYQVFLAQLTPSQRQEPVAAYRQLVWSEDRQTRDDAAWAWASWNRQLYYAESRPQPPRTAEEMSTALAGARLVQYYMAHGMFLTELFGPSPGNNQLLENAGRLPDIPISLVHGEVDLATPLEGARRLEEVLNRSSRTEKAVLEVVPRASHSSSEPGFWDALQRGARHVLESAGPVAPPSRAERVPGDQPSWLGTPGDGKERDRPGQ